MNIVNLQKKKIPKVNPLRIYTWDGLQEFIKVKPFTYQMLRNEGIFMGLAQQLSLEPWETILLSIIYQFSAHLITALLGPIFRFLSSPGTILSLIKLLKQT